MSAWDPQINVFDETQAKANIIAWIKLQQLEALRWANGSGPTLPAIKDFHTSPRLTTVFPALVIISTSHKSRYVDSNLFVDFAAVFEVDLMHGSLDTLTEMAPKYAMALESMLANMPETTFSQNSKIETVTQIETIDSSFGDQGKLKNKYVQAFRTSVAWSVEASAVN